MSYSRNWFWILGVQTMHPHIWFLRHDTKMPMVELLHHDALHRGWGGRSTRQPSLRVLYWCQFSPAVPLKIQVGESQGPYCVSAFREPITQRSSCREKRLGLSRDWRRPSQVVDFRDSASHGWSRGFNDCNSFLCLLSSVLLWGIHVTDVVAEIDSPCSPPLSV